MQGRIHRRGEGAIAPLDGCWPKTETPGRSKVGFISSRMHQNSFIQLKNRKVFWGGEQPHHRPIHGGEGNIPTPHLPLRLDPRAYGARLDSRARSRPPQAPPFAPSHTFWIRPLYSRNTTHSVVTLKGKVLKHYSSLCGGY